MTIAAGGIIRASHVSELVKRQHQASTGTTTWTAGSGNVRQNVTGLTFDVVTKYPNARVLVWWVIDCLITTTSAGNNFQFRLEVEGVAQGPLAIWPTTDASRGTPAAIHELLHADPGTYTYQITGLSGAAAAACQLAGGLSLMSALVIDKDV